MSNTTAHPGTLSTPRQLSAAPTVRRGRLFRAIVSLPEFMCPADETMHERIVFFSAPAVCPSSGQYLENLLSHVWNVEACGWCDDGHIYNITTESALAWDGVSQDSDARLFETACGGPDGVTYADPARVDFLVAPALKLRLQSALAKVKAAA